QSRQGRPDSRAGRGCRDRHQLNRPGATAERPDCRPGSRPAVRHRGWRRVPSPGGAGLFRRPHRHARILGWERAPIPYLRAYPEPGRPAVLEGQPPRRGCAGAEPAGSGQASRAYRPDFPAGADWRRPPLPGESQPGWSGGSGRGWRGLSAEYLNGFAEARSAAGKRPALARSGPVGQFARLRPIWGGEWAPPGFPAALAGRPPVAVDKGFAHQAYVLASSLLDLVL